MERFYGTHVAHGRVDIEGTDLPLFNLLFRDSQFFLQVGKLTLIPAKPIHGFVQGAERTATLLTCVQELLELNEFWREMRFHASILSNRQITS